MTTERLLLRRWCEDDHEPFAEMMADAEFNRYMPGPFDRSESDAMIEQFEGNFEIDGFGMWALELPGKTPFIGCIGLTVPRTALPFCPCVEIGWRIAPRFLNHGYATEGALAALRFGFEQAELDEIVSFTVPDNLASRRVMEKIRMRRDSEGDFEHPALAE
ncbi:MAG: GNAT family N-acetyltransferase, partial [Methanobacteriota archaeon]